MYKKILILFLFLGPELVMAQSSSSLLDSVRFYRGEAQKGSYSLNEQIKHVQKAIAFSRQYNKDSTLLKSRRLLATLYLQKRDVDTLLKINRDNLALANKINDSVAVGYISNVLGWCHSSKVKSDSAYYYYYNASKVFSNLNMEQNYAEALLNMANIQFEEKDYLGAESNAIRSVRLFQKFPKTEYNLDALWSIYNLLGILSDALGLYDNAIEYHEKALTYSDQIEDHSLYTLYSKSNIALIYKEQEKYKEAIQIYKELFEKEEELLKDLSNYALILSDYAFIKHLSGDFSDKEIKTMLSKSYKISDSIQDGFSIMTVSLNASEYYLDKKQKDSALLFANRAYTLAKETNSNDVTLKSLLLKSKIESPEKAKEYLKSYVAINDSLQDKERAIRNKFARIEFETDNLKERNKQIARERMWLIVLSASLVFTLILLYIIISQRAKNKELQLVQQQQEANEEIYNLMLSQQDKIDEARVIEKKRISEELHDGILGRLFGTRLSLDSLNMVSTDEAITNRSKYIEELKNIEHDIRKVSHELNTDFVSGSSFYNIIKSLVETQCVAYGLEFDLKNDDSIDWDNVSNKTKIHYYRILQESLQNIYKHANATKVEISFKQKNNVICLQVSDNGSGFDVSRARKGIGLKNIASRVTEIDGKLTIESNQENRTTITVSVPV
ncbi:ATP-binding protein [Mangrovimonas cancribranchiae]|uniref:histidine kinase n=1 Tax=Mangrovimonas cancribranchiae TaxID=3080055 RepID=A0AAU6P7C4_9FLAO